VITVPGHQDAESFADEIVRLLVEFPEPGDIPPFGDDGLIDRVRVARLEGGVEIDSTSVASLRRARIFVVIYAARPTAAGIP